MQSKMQRLHLSFIGKLRKLKFKLKLMDQILLNIIFTIGLIATVNLALFIIVFIVTLIIIKYEN